MEPVDRIDHLVINVRDVERSAAWYAAVLGMRPERINDRMVLWFGRSKLHVRSLTYSQGDWFTADHPAAGSDDLCFITPSKVNDIVDRLNSCGVAIEKGPVSRPGAQGEMISVYCRDPDGSLIEISTYGP